MASANAKQAIEALDTIRSQISKSRSLTYDTHVNMINKRKAIRENEEDLLRDTLADYDRAYKLVEEAADILMKALQTLPSAALKNKLR